ncbi:MAG: hypothetical protein ACPLPQ_07415 [Candidatus Saccharicenans sp.]
MLKKLKIFIACLLFLGVIFGKANYLNQPREIESVIAEPRPAASAIDDESANVPPGQQIPEPKKADCDLTQVKTDTGLVNIKKGEVAYVVINGVRYRCVGCEGCLPVAGGGQTSSLSLSQQMAMGLVETMINSVFAGMFDNLFGSPRSAQQEALIRQQQELQWQREQEEKKAAYNQWLFMQQQAEQKRLEEARKNKQIGEEILAKISLSGEVKKDSLGGGKLAPINWDAPRVQGGSVPPGQYDTSKMSEVERLLCASFFSRMAESAASRGDIEAAMFYGAQMDNVMQGLPISVECQLPKDLAGMTAAPGKLQEMNQKYARMAVLYQEVMPRVEKLRDIEFKLNDAAKKKEENQQRIQELDLQIEEIKARLNAADTPQKKAEEENLLAQALALRTDAEQQCREVIKTEEQLLKEKEYIEKDLNKIKELIQKGGLK